VKIGQSAADGVAGDFGTGPFDGKGDGGVTQYAEIVGAVSVLPNVFGVNDKVAAVSLVCDLSG
jgi:hypothetical protein